MAKVEIGKFSSPKETRKFGHGQLDLVAVGGSTVGRARFEPGWRWSKDVQAIAGTQSCLSAHLAYQVSGVLHVKMDDGTEFDVQPGEVSLIPPGHDAWVVGHEAVVSIDFTGMTNYAQQGGKK